MQERNNLDGKTVQKERPETLCPRVGDLDYSSKQIVQYLTKSSTSVRYY